jgi:hypothetical protein
MAKGTGLVGSMYVGVPSLYETFFDNVAETAAKTAFMKWREGGNPLYYEESGGGTDGPKMQSRMTSW